MKINKKKIACFALASALVIPGAIGLAGCEKGHTHAFTSDPFYEVVTEDGVKTARSWKECSCGAEDSHKKVDNAIIVSPNAQDDNYVLNILDDELTNKTIVFDEGTYSEELGITNAVTNVSFVGTKNAIFAQSLKFITSPMSNVTITNMVFSGEHGRINIYESGSHGTSQKENITISNCTFNSNTDTLPTTEAYTAIKLTAESWDDLADPTLSKNIKNVTVKNNYINGFYQGIAFRGCENMYVYDNEITNTYHNSIAIQNLTIDGTVFKFEGDAIIKNNKISNSVGNGTNGERAIRFGIGENANIIVENNTFTNCSEDRTGKTPSEGIQLLASNTLTNSTYSFKNNKYDGKLLEDASGNESSFIIYIEEPVIEE